MRFKLALIFLLFTIIGNCQIEDEYYQLYIVGKIIFSDSADSSPPEQVLLKIKNEKGKRRNVVITNFEDVKVSFNLLEKFEVLFIAKGYQKKMLLIDTRKDMGVFDEYSDFEFPFELTMISKKMPKIKSYVGEVRLDPHPDNLYFEFYPPKPE